MAADLKYDRPLTGTIAIYWFLKYTKLKSLTIAGFDHFETNNTHAKTGLVKPHKVEQDKGYITNLVDNESAYGVSGYGEAFEFDGTNYIPIYHPDVTTDKPFHINIHQERSLPS